MEDVFRHIDRVMELGGEKILGFGSDFDGIESWPDGLGSPADFPALIETMRLHGYGEDAHSAICWGNFWRVLKQAEAHRSL